MKKWLLSFLFFAIVHFAKSTDWFPVGAKWTWGSIQYCCGPPPYTNVPFYWNAVKDTVIQNKHCAIVEEGSYHYPQQPEWMYRYIYNEENGKITRFINDRFLPLYDFNLNAGDSTYIVTDSGLYACDTFLFKIDSVTRLGQDTSLRVQQGHIYKLDACGRILANVEPLRIIEKVGLPYFYTNDYSFIVDGDYEYARCYRDSVTDLHLIPDLDCDFRGGVSTWFPFGARSYWGFRMCCGPADYPYYWIVYTDTIIGRHDCRILLDNQNKRTIVTEDSNIVQKFVDGRFLPLYNFNKAAGDTVLFVSDSGKYSCDSFLFIIDSIRPLRQDSMLKVQYGKLKKNLFCNTPGFGDTSLKIIERMGIFRFDNISSYFSLEPDFSYERCYEESYLHIHFVSYGCDTTITRVKEKENSLLKIYPNPASDKIYLEYNGESSNSVNISLSDLQGKIIRQEEGLQNGEINVAEVTNGIYFIKIVVGDEFITKPFIIQH